MATIIRYVNTASSGGDGTTNATSGASAAYASLSACEAAERQTLTGVTCDVADADGNTTIALDILCSGSSADTTAVAFSSGTWATDATHRIRVRLNGAGAGARWDTSLYRLAVSAGYAVGSLSIGAALHIDLQDLQVDSTGPLGNAPQAIHFGAYAWDVRIYNGYYRLSGASGSWDNADVMRCVPGSAAFSLKMRNVTIVAYDGRGFVMDGASSTSAVFYAYNCTVVNKSANSRALFNTNMVAAAEARVKNLVMQGAGTSNYVVSNDTPDETLTNLTSDTTGTTGLQSKTLTFVDAANWDYHLASGDTDAIGAATDLSADSYWPFSTDGDGATRSSWDVGADEYASSVALDQEGFRWYEDNGSESGSSASAAQDTNITAAAGATKRLRILVNATGDPATTQFKLQWKKSGGSWADVL